MRLNHRAPGSFLDLYSETHTPGVWSVFPLSYIYIYIYMYTGRQVGRFLDMFMERFDRHHITTSYTTCASLVMSSDRSVFACPTWTRRSFCASDSGWACALLSIVMHPNSLVSIIFIKLFRTTDNRRRYQPTFLAKIIKCGRVTIICQFN